jgi:pyruvate dehydrogenase E1 component alpha subunit
VSTEQPDLEQLYIQMLRIRVFEETVAELRASNDIVGSVHLCNGQEGIYAGVVAALDLTRDRVFPTYRGHGYTIACGAPPREVFAELLGRATGINGGRGGSAYHFAPQYGQYGENSIVGAGAVIASGAALAAQYDGSGRIAVASFGEGAMNQGSVHEAFNFASARKLPVLFIVENNLYSELTPTTDMVSVDSLFRRASPYGMPGVRINGNNVLHVYKTVKEAARRARSGEGPAIIEAMTERLVGHYIGDAQVYRAEGEIESAAEREPLVVTARDLQAQGADPAHLEAIQKQIREEMAEAAAKALGDPVADPRTVEEHIYA